MWDHYIDGSLYFIVWKTEINMRRSQGPYWRGCERCWRQASGGPILWWIAQVNVTLIQWYIYNDLYSNESKVRFYFDCSSCILVTLTGFCAWFDIFEISGSETHWINRSHWIELNQIKLLHCVRNEFFVANSHVSMTTRKIENWTKQLDMAMVVRVFTWKLP